MIGPDETRVPYPNDHVHIRDAESCVWCCGCDVHPIGKPWGWNYRRWNRHFERAHDRKRVPDTRVGEHREEDGSWPAFPP